MSGMRDVQRRGPARWPRRRTSRSSTSSRAVPETRAYFSDDVHLTAAGNEILARMVFDWIVGHSLITAGSPRRSEEGDASLVEDDAVVLAGQVGTSFECVGPSRRAWGNS